MVSTPFLHLFCFFGVLLLVCVSGPVFGLVYVKWSFAAVFSVSVFVVAELCFSDSCSVFSFFYVAVLPVAVLPSRFELLSELLQGFALLWVAACVDCWLSWSSYLSKPVWSWAAWVLLYLYRCFEFSSLLFCHLRVF